MDSKILNLIVVSTKNQGLFVTDRVGKTGYYSSVIPNLFFDGEKLVKTQKDNWYILPAIPTKIERKLSDQNILKHWALKKGYPVSELTPEIIDKADWDEDDETAGLYSPVYDTTEGKLEKIEFEVEVLAEENNFYTDKPKYPYTADLITQLTVDPALHTERPCSITGKQFYTIIREYIKKNIDGKYARITSDYDFCLTVGKVIELAEPSPYKTNIGTKRRPNLVTRYNTSKTITVFSTSPEGYSGYPTQKGMTGKDYLDLEKNIEDYLKELIETINKPLKECPTCKGTGCVE